MHTQNRIRGIARFLYTQNPFYLISACLMLYGLQVAFRSHEVLPRGAWYLAAALGAYALLVAVTAYFVVRLGKVWQDARSLFLILVLMFFALSVSFDGICNEFPSTATSVLALGLGFSMMVTEGLIRVLNLRFPAAYRLPFYLVLVVFFLFPIWVSPAISELSAAAVAWRVSLFPAMCAGAFLTLVPAIRRGRGAVAANGTPWLWPWYPWTLFVFLALGVSIRAYVLTLSFQPARGLESSFGLYYLTPFFFALLVLLLEISVVERIAGLQRFVLTSAPLLVLSAIPWGGGEPFEVFLAELIGSLGSPVWLATLGLVLFYAYALQRNVRHAEIGLAAALLAASFVSPSGIRGGAWIEPQWWPLAALTVWQLERALLYRTAARWFAVACSVMLTAAVVGRGSWFTSHWGAIPLHLLLVTALLISYRFSDRFALWLRCVAAASLVGAGLWATVSAQTPIEVRTGYVAGLALLAATTWWLTRRRWWLIAVSTNLAGAALLLAAWLQSGVTPLVGQQAMLPLTWALRCFVIAAVISALKGGLYREIQLRLRRWVAAGRQGRVWI